MHVHMWNRAPVILHLRGVQKIEIPRYWEVDPRSWYKNMDNLMIHISSSQLKKTWEILYSTFKEKETAKAVS